MNLSLVRHLWGVDLSRGYIPYLEDWHRLEYKILESSPRLVPDLTELRRVLAGEGLGWIPQVFSNMFLGAASVETHLSSMREQIEECLDADPLFFNAHSGSDAWSLEEAEEFYLRVGEMESELGCVIVHETHRSRCFGHPWNTIRLLDRVSGLKLTCDFSHWVCYAERLLADADSVIERAARHCHHLHARVGYEQGPQVPDPRAPEWNHHLRVHERWWEWIWRSQRDRGMKRVTLTPEFGPPPYQQVTPFTLEPVCNLAEVCDWMADRQRSHFAAWSDSESNGPSNSIAGVE